MEFVLEEIIKLGLAVLVGGLIGAEREFRDKAAGFRTIIFITIGSTLFTMLSLSIGNETNPTRIAANIVTGIGFLGVGAIMRDGVNVTGLTTAATIWLAASLGMGLGGGRYMLVGIATVIILVVLWFFPAFEHWIDNIRETRNYEISLPLGSSLIEKLPQTFSECGLKISTQTEHKMGNNITLAIYTIGKPVNHKNLVKRLMQTEEIVELRY
jgi:putative Mg2+ transporter-C (MgtC) family protein